MFSRLKDAWSGAQKDADSKQSEWEARTKDWSTRTGDALQTAPVVTRYYRVHEGIFGPITTEIEGYPVQVPLQDTVYAREHQLDPKLAEEGFVLALTQPDRNEEVAVAFLTRVDETYGISQKLGTLRRAILPTIAERREQKQRWLSGK